MSDIDAFMTALFGAESGGDPNVVNSDSGAHGKYQIMPENWPSWAAEAGLPSNAPKTERNQDIVARHKIQQYYNQYGNWGDVAAAWYSGQPLNPATKDRPQNGYPSIQSYVDTVLGAMGAPMAYDPTNPNASPFESTPPPYNGPPPTSATGPNGGPTTSVSNGYVYQWDDVYEQWVSVGQVPRAPSASEGYIPPDHYFDVSGNTAASIAEDQRQFNAISPYQQAGLDNQGKQIDLGYAQLNADMAKNDRDYALSVGDQELARQKQADLNYWNGISAQQTNDGMRLDARGQDMDYAAAIANVEQARYASDQRFQSDMANATNDQQRNVISARWNEEQAAIAKMEDETRRVLGGQQNQTAQFSSETDRQARMGNLALDNNKFIADMASGARGADLFSLYFMQRGVAPDFNTMANGGTPAQGAALAPADVMNAYTPTTAAPVFNGVPQNSSAAQVGKASAAGTQAAQQANSFIGASTAKAPMINYGAGGTFTPTAIPTGGPPQVAQPPAPIPSAPGGNYSGVPRELVEGLLPGMSKEVTTGQSGPSQAADFTGMAVYDAATGQRLTGEVGAGQRVRVQRMAEGGVTRAKLLMLGDAAHPNPEEGGAVPEIVENKTGAPLKIHANQRNLMNMGVSPQMQTMDRTATTMPMPQQRPSFSGFGPGNYGQRGPAPQAQPAMSAQQQMQNAWRNRQPLPQQGAPGQAHNDMVMANAAAQQTQQAKYAQIVAAMAKMGGAPQGDPYAAMQPAPQPGMYAKQPWQGGDPYAAQQPQSRSTFPNMPMPVGQKTPWQGPPPNAQGATPLRFALGTDASAQYADQGMADSWIPESGNTYLQGGAPLPQRLQMLANYGMPIAPSLYTSATGQTLPQNNFGSAFTEGRQAGVLPSMQTLNRMSPGEQEVFKGYSEGVAKVPWKDLVDYLQRGTQHLGAAQRARAA